jgi:hypothetical protein
MLACLFDASLAAANKAERFVRFPKLRTYLATVASVCCWSVLLLAAYPAC